jgi:hypothetical protein
MLENSPVDANAVTRSRPLTPAEKMRRYRARLREARADGEVAPRRARRYEPKRRVEMLAGLDQRSRAYRRIAALVSMWAQQLGGKLTDGQRIALERAAGLVVISEDTRLRRLSGDLTISLNDIARLDNAASRAMNALGLPEERDGEHESELRPLKWE